MKRLLRLEMVGDLFYPAWSTFIRYLFMSLNLGEGQILWTEKRIKGNLPLVSTFPNLSGSVFYQRIHHLFLYT